MDIESIAMELVGNSGECKSLAFEALDSVKKGNFEDAKNMIKDAEKKILAAHSLQTELICKEADGEKLEMNILMVHAQDHLMTSILAKDLVKEFIELYRTIKN